MPVIRFDVTPRPDQPADDATRELLHLAGLEGATRVERSSIFILDLDEDDPRTLEPVRQLLADPVLDECHIFGEGESRSGAGERWVGVEIYPKPGVMDPVAETTLDALRARGVAVTSVRTGVRYLIEGLEARVSERVGGLLANDSVERAVIGGEPVGPSPIPPEHDNALRTVAVRALDDAQLESLSRSGHLFLSLEEMRAIQAHFRALEREPTDLELETLAQTWSEHCVHKTLKSSYAYRGAPMPETSHARPDAEGVVHYDNLLRDTIARATQELISAQRGPECLSVFVDNAGIIGFDDAHGVAFKVETHNRPSAIEPYGGAATGIGGCIRDIMGCGRGAKPIASTDVFCVAPTDWSEENLPRGVLHPRRVLRGVVSGVADYGNRMGIPTVNGAVHFDPRYLGNPLVYCGCVGLIPRDLVSKGARAGDKIVVMGGRTGRDGIHGATFSSAELTTGHAEEFSNAVQIGNAITQKRCLDALLRARDHESGCLFSSVTDCGAGGLSSAVGEMGETLGVDVELSEVPLKYAGLRYDEIWISEAQERMVLAVPPENVAALQAIAAEESVDATVIGTFGCMSDSGDALLTVRYRGAVVGELAMAFMHDGVPQTTRVAEWQPAQGAARSESNAVGAHTSSESVIDQLLCELGRPGTASNEWIIRRYDHEVQGGSVVKPLAGPGSGPGDAAVVTPVLGSRRGIAVGCGMAPHLADVDPYWMAVHAIDEALRNIVSVGGDPRQAAILDNFCWGSTQDAQQLGALVRACQACHDAALAYGVPFISGKDSLNNQFALDAADVERVRSAIEAYAKRPDAPLPIRQGHNGITAAGRLQIPPTLLISAIGLVDDVAHCVHSALPSEPGALVLIRGRAAQDASTAHVLDMAAALRVHLWVAAEIREGNVGACHDVSDGGWLTAVAEMVLGADERGAKVSTQVLGDVDPFAPLPAAYVIATRGDAGALIESAAAAEVDAHRVGEVIGESGVRVGDQHCTSEQLRGAWARPAAP